jgi:RNA polymerase sigma factor (sigma-70 family)
MRGPRDSTDALVPDPGGGVAGARATFEDLYRTTYARMARVAYLITGSTDLAEEIVQDAFVALYPRFDTIDEPRGYLYRSVVNGCRARFRRKQVTDRLGRMRIVSEVEQPELDETRAALSRLSSQRRTVVILRYYADLRIDDIADLLGCRPGTVKSQLHRALAELKDLIDE